MLPALLDFFLKATRPLFFGVFLVPFLVYLAPSNVILEVGFPSIDAARWCGALIQVFAAAVLGWPLADRVWLDSKKARAARLSRDERRVRVMRLSKGARDVLGYLVHSAKDKIYFPMGDESCLELERAGLLRRFQTKNDAAEYRLTDDARALTSADHAWVVGELPCDARLSEMMSQTSSVCCDKLVGRI